jgi:hypothetical protein
MVRRLIADIGASFAAMSNPIGATREDKYRRLPLIINREPDYLSISGAGPMMVPAPAHQ